MNLYYYIKTAVKTLLQNKAYSLINILGLSFGLSLSIIILLFVKYELNYDSQFPQSENLYRLTSKGIIGTEKINDAITPLPLINIVNALPETKSASRFIPGINKLIKYKSLVFNENRFYFGDSSFFNTFNLKIIQGSLKSFDEPETVIITNETAKKYFSESNPIGKTINRGGVDYKIIAVCLEMPQASHFHFDFMASMSTIDLLYKNSSKNIDEWKNNWLSLDCYTYVIVKYGTDISLFEEKLNKKKEQYISEQISKTEGKNLLTEDQVNFRISLQPVRTIHLHSNLAFELEPVSNPIHILIYISIAIFILLITSINFINITTAQPTKRLKEAAIREAYGAKRYHISLQIIAEAFIISATATLLGLVLAELIIPLFNNLFGLSLHISQIQGMQDIGIVLLIAFFVGIISGAYPAKFFSEIEVKNIFRNRYIIKKSTLTIRGFIVTGHIFVVLFLSLLTAGIWWQTNFLENTDLGFNKKNLLILERGYAVKHGFEKFKKELKMIKGVRSVSSAMFLPGDEYYRMAFTFKDNQQNSKLSIPINHVDCDYLETMGLKLKRGTFLSCQFKDSMGIILNSAAIRSLHIKKPLDEHFEINKGTKADSWKINILGVVSDYHYESLTKELQPLGMMLLCNQSYFKYIIIKLEEKNNRETIDNIQSLWHKHTNHEPMDSFFLEDRLSGLYQQDIRMLKAISIFTLFSYFISVLGFLSLASFILEYKNRRISYLKTIGIPDIYILRDILGSFSKHVITGISLSIPLAMLAVKIWLQNYAYTDTIPWWLYIIITVIVLIIGILSIVFQYYKIVIKSRRFHQFKGE